MNAAVALVLYLIWQFRFSIHHLKNYRTAMEGRSLVQRMEAAGTGVTEYHKVVSNLHVLAKLTDP